MTTQRSFETSVITYQSTRRHKPEHLNFQQRYCENLKSRKECCQLHDGVLEVGAKLPSFLILVLDRDKWSVSRPGRFSAVEIVPANHWTVGWMGRKAGFEPLEEREVFCPYREPDEGRSIVQPSS